MQLYDGLTNLTSHYGQWKLIMQSIFTIIYLEEKTRMHQLSSGRVQNQCTHNYKTHTHGDVQSMYLTLAFRMASRFHVGIREPDKVFIWDPLHYMLAPSDSF